jgi:hypothetical protein
MKLYKHLLTAFIAHSPLFVYGEIAETIRASKAVVRYEFNEASGNLYSDTANSKFGTPLNLSLLTSGTVSRGVDSSGDRYISVESASVIQSSVVASKILNNCNKNTSTGITVEAIIENNESVQLRAAEYPKNILQPLRIISYSNAFTNSDKQVNVNFALGQSYDMGDIYLGAVTTGGNNNLFTDPVVTNNSSIMINGISRAAPLYKQTIIMTASRGGVGRLYLTDRNGNLYQAAESSKGFTGASADFFKRWNASAYLNVANDYIDKNTIGATLNRYNQFASATCSGDCANNPNRFWKGKIYRLAVYCDALTKSEIFGSAYTIATNESFPISSVTMTPSLAKASDMYERLVGAKTPIYNPLLSEMAIRLDAKDPVGAASLLTEQPLFYNLTVRNFASKMSVRDETISTMLNDFTATVIGAVRDELDAKTLLSGNYFYQADPTKAAVPSDPIDDLLKSNNHYEALDRGDFDLKSVLIRKTPQVLFDGTNVVTNPTSAGLLTTRQWAAAHYIAGTNRRPVEFALREFTCLPIENAGDATGPEDMIGRDVDRNPAGSMGKFASTCRACHTVLDGFRPAFAYMTFSNNFLKNSVVVPTSIQANLDEDTSNAIGVHPDAPRVARKFNRNETTFPGGKIVTDDKWVNNANLGGNKLTFGWTKSSGTGVAEFGQAIAESKAFPRCMAKRVFFTVCKREATTKDDAFIGKVADEFSSATRNYNLKYLFQRIGSDDACLGGG